MTSLVSSLILAASAVAPTAEQIEFFETRIRPVLAQECYECHNSRDENKAGLVLDYREGLLKGGDTGPAIIPGKADESLLMEAIRHEYDLEMPKAGVKLEARILADFEKWINMGAPDPRDAPPTDEELAEDTNWPAVLERRKAWWSFQPIKNPTPPASDWSDHPVDRFVHAKMTEAGLSPAEPADPRTLVRRLYLTLIGLPPTPDQIDEYLQSHIQNPISATESLIDHLLASPHFGERWARHWMDWIRYAESHGSEGDPAIPNAHAYRDYLIRALNNDVPYDQLVREAVAGDLLDDPRLNQELGLNESEIGPAHLRMVFHGFAPTDALDEKVRFTDDQINVFSKAFLGLTISCARCHDHKFDAISQADYYAMFGIFGSTRPALRDVALHDEDKRNELAKLKAEIKKEIARIWESEVENAPEKPAATFKTAEFPNAAKIWEGDDFQSWFRRGLGAPSSHQAGEFAVSLQGDEILRGIYPSGGVSNIVSTKDRAVLESEQFDLDGEYDLWLQVAGEGEALVRYVVQNYPRRGTVYKNVALKGGDWKWQKFDLGYWKGDRIHIELAHAADSPVLAKPNADRSWFAIRRAVLLPKGSPAPKNDAVQPNRSGLKTAISAWREGNATDEQALLLDRAMRDGILSNSLKKQPGIATRVTRYRRLEASLTEPIRVPSVAEADARDQPLFERGDHKKPTEEIPRRFLDAIDAEPYDTDLSGRRQLVEDLLRDDNPLTRRVIVNRVWHHLFGSGLVDTPDNFGRLGSKPTHPELLDHLASKFSADFDWSLKELIRHLVTSQTWQLSSSPSELAEKEDPANQWLSHFNIRRLEAEILRDSLLAVSGQLDRSLFGNPVDGTSNRRSVYVKVIRNRLDPFLATFDAPIPFSATGRRDVTNVPAQSLMMMNNEFVMDAAARFASRTSGDDPQRIREMWLMALGRPPRDTEKATAMRLLEILRESYDSIEAKQAEIDQSLADLEKSRQSILSPIRQRLQAELDQQEKPEPVDLNPIAQWDFENDLKDAIGRLHGKVVGSARIENGALVVDGNGLVLTEPLDRDVKAKTLEAVVQLGTLDQQGGGVMTVQDLNGGLFDSIVFAERKPRQWMAGSNHFKRTDDFNGPPEKQADEVPVRIAIVYDEDGTIRGYRNGEPYGKPYRKAERATFKAGQSQVAFGIRHGKGPGGNRMLNGRILEARLYDRALSPEEIAASASGVQNFITKKQIDAELSEAQRTELKRIASEMEKLKTERESLGQPAGEAQVWNDFAHSIFNFKEFIYVR